MDTKIATFALAGALAAPQPALAQDAGAVYNLGEIHVTAPGETPDDRGVPVATPATQAAAKIPFQSATPKPLGGDTISAEKFETFEKATLDKAVELTPGVVAYDMAGSRNEQNIYVHGFDRWQVPILLDGVRIYLPVDNRLDFGRFLTSNLAQVQISKGYASVLDGPGAMGGEINLVTRKPTRAVEGEIGTDFDFSRSGWYTGSRTYARVGTKQDLYYLQAAGAFNNSRGWELPDAYVGNVHQGEGLRGHSAAKDRDINLKAGYTPNATDEYSINYLRQEGQKGAPYNVSQYGYSPYTSMAPKYWTWPYWDVQSLAALTHTQIDPTAYVNTKIFWNRFDNALRQYSDAAQTTQNDGNAGNSSYHDWSLGGSVEAGKDILPWDTLKAALHYRRDTHNEQSFGFTNPKTGKTAGCVANTPCYASPVINEYEDTYSVALENTAHVWDHVDLVQGFSYEWRNTLKAQGFNGSTAPYGMIYYPNSYAAAPNGQVAAIWRYNDTDKVYLTFSDRTRFPTLFERYSTKFGYAIANASLRPERAANVQLGWEGYVAQRLKVEADVYGSDVQDMIGTVQNIPLPNGKTTTQSQNIGHGHILGADLKADWAAADDLALGGHASLIHRWVNYSKGATGQLTGVPGVSAFFYAQWRPLANVTLTPDVQIAGQRWSSNAAGNGYVQTGAYALVNFKAEWRAYEGLTFTAGARNLTDRLYVLSDGYPEPGRTFYLGARYTF